MVTTERLREMQLNEFKIIQRSMGHAGAKQISAELGEALGELIARRELDAARTPELAPLKQGETLLWGADAVISVDLSKVQR